MPTAMPVYQEVFQALANAADGRVRFHSLVRLALLVVGIIKAESCVVHRVAQKLAALGLTGPR